MTDREIHETDALNELTTARPVPEGTAWLHGRPTGSPRDVLDWISWMQHCARVRSLCDSVLTAIAVFDTFVRSAAVERGRHVELPK